MDKHDNPFEILGIDPNADESTIKKVYFKLARQYHPDKQESEEDKEEMGSKFAKISDAYDLLTDPVRKQAWEQKKQEREARQRSRSPKAPPQRRHSGKRTPPSSPGTLNRPKQHPIIHNMPKRHYSPTRSPPRNIRTTKRSVSPVPTRNGSTNSQQHRQSPRQKPSRKISTSPKRQRSTGARRTASPKPPRHPSPGKYQQSASPGTRRRKQYYNPSASLQTPASSSVPKPQGVRRASSGGPIHTQPMANIFASMRDEEGPEKPRSCPRASWSSTTSINTEDLKKETTKKHPFEALGLHPFEVLGLPPTADKVEILTAYRALSFEYRPTNRSNSTGTEKQEAARQMARVAWAYEELKDPEKLQEWQQKVGSSKATINHDSHCSENKFHDSVSSNKSWGVFRNNHHREAGDDDDDDSFIGDDAHKLKSALNSPNNSIRSRGRNKLTERSTSPKSGIKKKVALLSSLGFPKRRSVSPKPTATTGGKQRSSLFSSLTSNKNDSPVQEEQVPTKIVTDEARPKEEQDQPVKKLKKKKKKKKKKSLTDTSSGEVDKDPITSKKLKKQRKKKKHPKSPTNKANGNPADFTWKREESKMVIVAPEGSRSNRTATTLADEDPAVVLVAH